ncbi:MAG: tetratricopeptide repeat protein [Candidatus Polarisedimenticolia bacterium]
MRPMGRSTTTTWLSNLALSFVAVIVFAAVGETVLWLAGAPTLRESRDPFRGFSNRVRVFEEDRSHGVFRTAEHAMRHSFRDQRFLARRPSGGLRVFVLGGSSAYGFPHDAGTAFAALLGRTLELAHPDRRVEVVNAAAMSYGSHRLRVLAHEVLEHEVDVLVLYEAHNEFVEERFYRQIADAPRALEPLRARLHGTRLYSALTFGLQGLMRREPPAIPAGALLGLDVAREDASHRRDDDKRLAVARFRENLSAVLDLARRRGTQAVLCTVAANLRDWPPNQSLFDPSTSAEGREEALALEAAARTALDKSDAAGALAAIQRATMLAPGHAGFRYLEGRALEGLARWDEARTAYRRAADDDAQPARALSNFNDTIRRLASERSLPLADIERHFERSSPHGLVGFNLIEDYVHPTAEGHQRIAFEVWRVMEEAGLAGDPARADEALFGRVVAAARAARNQAEAPTADRLFNMAIVLERQGLDEKAADAYRRCLQVNPSHHMAAYNLGRLLHESRRPDLAEPVFRSALSIEPGHVPSRVGLGLCLVGLDRIDEAVDQLRTAVSMDAASAPAWSALGTGLVLAGDLHAALEAFGRAVELQPEDGVARAHLGSMQMAAGDLDAAIATLRHAIALRHDLPYARNDLADALRARGERAEAEALYRSSLRADPSDTRARAGLVALEATGPTPPESGPLPPD